jgi:molecular chaperone DnaK
MDERVFTEARLKAEEMLPAIDSALAQLADEVPAEVRAAISDLVEKTRAALESHSAPDLKAHLLALDTLTEPLAAVLLEKAIGQQPPAVRLCG